MKQELLSKINQAVTIYHTYAARAHCVLWLIWCPGDALLGRMRVEKTPTRQSYQCNFMLQRKHFSWLRACSLGVREMVRDRCPSRRGGAAAVRELSTPPGWARPYGWSASRNSPASQCACACLRPSAYASACSYPYGAPAHVCLRCTYTARLWPAETRNARSLSRSGASSLAGKAATAASRPPDRSATQRRSGRAPLQQDTETNSDSRCCGGHVC